ncbi:hypothetical protein Sste5346_004715 [Sporothrix stenoceras]|uniref:Autophagy-related protein 29 n=1 Tax=Sporothrix stenoceras TaxID=5173 RepID=A0ABR3Z6Q8_9PEZI
MDFDPKHDQALDLPLRFPDDPVDEPPPPTPSQSQQPLSTSMRRQKSQDPQQQSQKQAQSSPVPTASPPSPQPTYTVYIRVPAPRNGFVDPPDVDWNKEKDDALWRILSRASKDDIDWEELAQSFNATVGFLLIQATILTERHVSQVRAQTRKVATLGANANTNTNATTGRDSPMNSPSLTSEAMGRTLSSGGAPGTGGPTGVRTASAETMRRTASAGSRAPYRGGTAGPSGTSPSVGGGSRSGSRRPSMEDSQIRPTRPPIRPSLETISSFSPDMPIATTTPPVGGPSGTVGRGHPTFSPAAVQQQQARLQSPLPIRPARPTDAAVGRRGTYDSEGEDDGEYGGEDEAFEPESPAATSDSDSSSSSSTPSEPVMSRIFRRPPGHAPQPQQQQQQPTSRASLAGRQRGNNTTQGADGDFGVIGLGISSGGSDEGDADADGDGEESETQAAFLRFKSNTTKGARATPGQHQHQHARHHHHHQKRRSTADSSSPSSSASASPTTKAFKTPTVAAAAAAAAGSSSSASAAAAARLQSSRIPGLSSGGGIRSPPRLQKMSASAAARSPAARAATRGAAGVSGISREGSEIGTTPSIGSSFSDLDDVSFTQSVLDEALGSKVEDTVVTPNPNSSNTGDPMSSSATRRR